MESTQLRGDFIVHKRLRAFLFALVLLSASFSASAQSAATAGQWQTLSYLMPINPVHTALMPNGKVLVVAGSGNYPPNLTNNILQAVCLGHASRHGQRPEHFLGHVLRRHGGSARRDAIC